MNKALKLTLITTGGTLDGTCHDLGVVGGPSLLRSTLESNANLDVTTITICNKDSRDLDDEDRKLILAEVMRESTGRVLIGHGTYTICETGRFLKAHLSSSSKRVLLLGAWIPLDHPDSDGLAQINYAIEAVRACPVGTFVAMDGRLWNPTITAKRQGATGKWEFVEIVT